MIVLVGNPNSGKTTLFNVLTGAHQRVGNWSGVTVERKSGFFCQGNQQFEVLDLPGTYSLSVLESDGPQDENLTSEFLRNQSYSLVLNVVDALHLERNLFLTLQCLEQQLPVMIVLNRMDLAPDNICIDTLSKALGCPILPISARDNVGLDALRDAFLTPLPKSSFSLLYPPVIEKALKDLNVPRSEGLRLLETESVNDSDVLIATARYEFIENLLRKAHQPNVKKKEKTQNVTRLIDKVVCHRFWGMPVFLLAMYSLFFFAINIGGFFQEYVEGASQAIFVNGMAMLLQKFASPTWVHAVLVSGLGEGIATVLTFVPVIGAMFLALAFLEDCGYMSRAAFVIDRLMRAVGLPGKSFVPMIVGFGCNVPAIMGMRSLENKRDRILAVMMSPFMSCGARLAIFTVFVAAFFPVGGQNIVFLLYVIGILMAVMTGLLLKKTLLKGEIAPLLLEMPEYQWPHWRSLWFHAWHRLKRFVFNAGKLIIPVCMLIGGLNNIPTSSSPSVLAEIGKTIVPIFEPMGVEEENWPAAVGLVTGILAKEVVIGSLNSLYLQSSTAPEEMAYGEMVKRFGSQSAAFAYLLFVLLYFPCISATAAMVREVQRGWTIFSVFWTTGLAYAVAVSYYQAACFFDHPLKSSLWLLTFGIIGWLTFVGIRRYSFVHFPRTLPTPIIVK